MKIEEASIYVHLDDIAYGECFRTNRDSPNVYMKVSLKGKDDVIVCMKSGEEVELGSIKMFVPVDAKLVVR